MHTFRLCTTFPPHCIKSYMHEIRWKCTRYADLVVRFSQAWNPISQSISCSFLQMLFPRCRNCTISHIALLPWNPISSVVPTLQKLYDFTYCAAALEPYQFSCSHAAEIARFHILRCCLGTLSVQLFPRCRNCKISHFALLPWNPISSVVPTLQKLHDFTYCAAALELYQFRQFLQRGNK